MSIPSLEHPSLGTWIRGIVFFAGWVTVATCGVWSGLLFMDRVDQVNARLPERERFNMLGWYWGKSVRFKAAYKHFFPEIRAPYREYKLMAVMFAARIVMFLSLAF